MTLRVLLPYQVLTEVSGVRSVTADTTQGSLGLLPQRLDCVAILVPGILSYRCEATDLYIAVDAGVLVKAGLAVSVSVRNAIVGLSLQELRAQVAEHFLRLDEEERMARSALAKIEVGFLRRFDAMRHER